MHLPDTPIRIFLQIALLLASSGAEASDLAVDFDDKALATVTQIATGDALGFKHLNVLIVEVFPFHLFHQPTAFLADDAWTLMALKSVA